jgi:archaellum component FlaC
MSQINFIPPDVEMQQGTNPYANDAYNTWEGIVSDPNRIRGYIISLISALNSVVEQINNNDTSYNERITNIYDGLQATLTQLNNIKSELSNQSQDITNIDTTLSELTTIINELQSNLNQLSLELTTVKEQINTIKENVDTILQAITSIQQDMERMLVAIQEAQQKSVMYGGNFTVLNDLPVITGIPNQAYVIVGTGDMTDAKIYIRNYNEMEEYAGDTCLGKFDNKQDAPEPTELRQFIIIENVFYYSEYDQIITLENPEEPTIFTYKWSDTSSNIFAIVDSIDNMPSFAPLENSLYQIDYEYEANSISDLPTIATRGDTAKVGNDNYIFLRSQWQQTDNTLYPKFYIFNDNLYKRIYRPFDTLASLTADGFMSKETFSSLTQALQDIQTLKEQGNFIGQEFETKADLDNFVTTHQTDDSISSNDFTYVEQDETHSDVVARYIFTRNDANTLTVAFAYAISDPIATNLSLGLVMGSIDNLKAKVETDGTISINGLSNLSDNVASLSEIVTQLESSTTAAKANMLVYHLGSVGFDKNENEDTVVEAKSITDLGTDQKTFIVMATSSKGSVRWYHESITDFPQLIIPKSDTDIIGQIIFVSAIVYKNTEPIKYSNQVSFTNIDLSQYATNSELSSQIETVNENISDLSSNLSSKEDSSNKVIALTSSSTDIQYPSAKVVYDTIQQAASTLPSSGLKVPIELATESQLPAITQDKTTIGNYYVIQNMDITAPNHTGKAWINYTDPADTTSQLKYYKMYDNFLDPDNSTIVLDKNNKLSVNSTYLQNYIDSVLTLATGVNGNIQPKLSAGNNIVFNSDKTKISAYSYSTNAGYIYQAPQTNYMTFDSGSAYAWVGQRNITLVMKSTNQPDSANFRVTAIGTIVFGTSELDINNQIYPVDIYAVAQNTGINSNSYKIFARKPDSLLLYALGVKYNYYTTIVLGARVDGVNLYVQSYTKFNFVTFGTAASNYTTAYSKEEFPTREMNKSYSLQQLLGYSNAAIQPTFPE